MNLPKVDSKIIPVKTRSSSDVKLIDASLEEEVRKKLEESDAKQMGGSLEEVRKKMEERRVEWENEMARKLLISTKISDLFPAESHFQNNKGKDVRVLSDNESNIFELDRYSRLSVRLLNSDFRSVPSNSRWLSLRECDRKYIEDKRNRIRVERFFP